MARKEPPHAFLITVERQRTIIERRTVRVVAYTAPSAKVQAKQRHPREGWREVQTASGINSATTTRFFEVIQVQDAGPAQGVPIDPEELGRFFEGANVTIEGE